ncbi:MAG TPA: hypothetical protein DFH97_04110 [Clostridiales bacterium]|nr:hypothetical protein [Clostridiales bacterium]
MRKMAVLVLACALLLTGCGTVDSTADVLADGIAGQVESMYGQATPAPVPDRESVPAPTTSAVDLAEQARQAYESLKEENRENPMLRPWEPLVELAQIQDMDGDGIPELILATYVTYETVGFQWEGREIYDEFEGPIYAYSVYTYGESGLQTLISNRPTLGIVAAGCNLVIGADQMDGQPVVVVLSSDGGTGDSFGDEGYTCYIHVEAVNPFTGQCLEKLDQEINGSRAIDCSGGSISERVGHYTYLTLDENGILTFPQVQAATPSAVWDMQKWKEGEK